MQILHIILLTIHTEIIRPLFDLNAKRCIIYEFGLFSEKY